MEIVITTDFVVHALMSLLLGFFLTGYEDLEAKDIVVIVLILGLCKEFAFDVYVMEHDAEWQDLYGNIAGIVAYLMLHEVYNKI